MKFIKLSWDKELGPSLYFNFLNKQIGLCFCHHRKDRSVNFFGLEKILCSRCIGILFGSIVAIWAKILQYDISIIILAILMIPMLFDGFSQLFQIRESNNTLRLTTGFLFGFGFQSLCIMLILWIRTFSL